MVRAVPPGWDWRGAGSLEAAGYECAGCVLDGLTGRILRNGTEAARTSDPQANTGNLIDIVRHVADVLAEFGEQLRAGQIIITGSIVPPLWVEAGEEVVFHLDPLGSVAIRFAPASSLH